MKVSLLTIFTALIILAVASCQKSYTGLTDPSTKIKTYIEDASKTPYNSIDTFNIAYDASDRIISMVSTSGSGGLYYSYTATSYTLDIKQGTHLVIREVSYINSNQLVDSTFQYNDTNDSSTSKLIFNAGKQLIQMLYYDYTKAGGGRLSGAETYTYDASGNMITQTDTNASGAVTETKTSTYSSFTANIGLFNMLYRPSLYKNLPLTITTKSPSGNIISIENRAYTFDSNNRVVTQTDSDNYGNVVVKTFLYY